MFYLRVFLTAVWFFTACILIIPYSFINWRNPTNGSRFSYLFTRGASFLLGIKIQVHNKERLLASQPCVYVANHQDTADLVFIGYTYSKNTAIVGKKEMLYIPFFGAVFYLTGNILLQRHHRDQSVAKMKAAVDYITKRKCSILVFVEGTRNQGVPNLLPFKKGAFYLAISAQVPIVPIVGAPNWKVVDVRKKKLYGGTAHVEVLEPIPTKGLTENDVDKLIELTRDRMQKTFTRLST